MTIIYSLLVFLLVILVHEFGHFAVAKMSDMKVNEFSIGMGPLVASTKGEETQYSFRAIPLGGYVALEGEDEDSSDPRSFKNASPLKRIAVLFAGAFMNFTLAILAFTIVFSIIGTPGTTIDKVVENTPAEVVGLQTGDRIISIDNKPVEKWEDITTFINESTTESINMVVERDSQNVDINIPVYEEEGSRKIGITPKYQLDLGNALGYAFTNTRMVIVDVYKFVGRLLTGEMDLSAVSGPIGVIRFIGESSQSGILNVLFVLGAISANLGAFNILPIPALDGGKILLTFVEMIIGRKMPEKIEEWLNIAGFVLLFGLMIYVTIFNDIL